MKRESLERQLADLPSLSRKELLKRFHEEYGREAPLRLSNKILTLAVAYRMQEKVYGGLKPEIRRTLLAGPTAPVLRPASPGTVFIREWHGQQYTVTVHADRVEYAGQSYRSLSEVACLITGSKRSGPQFFGLRGRRD